MKAAADCGIGRWIDSALAEAPDADAARALLTAIGYDPEAPLADVLAAFQRRWRPARIDGALDAETMGLIRALAR